MTLSFRTRESIKTALAMTIAYGIALWMDWDNPKWAGFAVAMISLATIGQSLNKATLRMAGTLVGMVVAEHEQDVGTLAVSSRGTPVN